MSLEVITGLPGAGKTAFLVARMTQLRAAGASAVLAISADSGELAFAHQALLAKDGTSCSVDVFASTVDTIAALDSLSQSGQTYSFAFDEAQYFLPAMTEAWIRWSDLGHSVIISTPNHHQLNRLRKVAAQIVALPMACELLGDAQASEFFRLPQRLKVISVCSTCAKDLQQAAQRFIYDRITRGEPHPGSAISYQPTNVESGLLSTVKSLRDDSSIRADIMLEYIESQKYHCGAAALSYLDVGCKTGYFCSRLADYGLKVLGRGITVLGVDIGDDEVRIGRALQTYFHRTGYHLEKDNVIEFLLRSTQQYDIVSSFSVFQSLYVTEPIERVDRALLRLFERTRKLLFFEVGYSSELPYAERLPQLIDRAWCFERLDRSKLFQKVYLVPAGERGIERDLFIAVRAGA